MTTPNSETDTKVNNNISTLIYAWIEALSKIADEDYEAFIYDSFEQE